MRTTISSRLAGWKRRNSRCHRCLIRMWNSRHLSSAPWLVKQGRGWERATCTEEASAAWALLGGEGSGTRVPSRWWCSWLRGYDEGQCPEQVAKRTAGCCSNNIPRKRSVLREVLGAAAPTQMTAADSCSSPMSISALQRKIPMQISKDGRCFNVRACGVVDTIGDAAVVRTSSDILPKARSNAGCKLGRLTCGENGAFQWQKLFW